MPGGTASGWPVNLIPEEYRQVQPSDVEMLLVSGPLDFTAPPGYVTEELLPHLSNGQQVILKEFGHTVDFWNLQPEARVRLLTGFYDTGVADDSLYTYQPVDLTVDVGYPAQAKLLLAIVVVVPLGLVAVVWFIVRFATGHFLRQQAVNCPDRAPPGHEVPRLRSSHPVNGVLEPDLSGGSSVVRRLHRRTVSGEAVTRSFAKSVRW